MMEDTLRDLPETLEGLYEDMLKRIPKVYKEKARSILMWLAYSLQPLTLQELASAVSIPNPQKVLEVCNSSLVSLQRPSDRSHEFDDQHQNISNSIVKLDHFSVKEYLSSDHLLASEHTVYIHASPIVAHLTIAETLVSHIINTNHIDFPRIYTSAVMPGPIPHKPMNDPIAKEDSLLRYSTILYRHINEADQIITKLPESKKLTSKARSAEAQLDLELLRTKAHRLFYDEFSQSFRNWCHLIRYPIDRFMEGKIQPILASMITHASPILIASLLDMVDNVRRLLSDGVNIDGDVKIDVTGITKPVQAAAVAGSLIVLRLLLDGRAILDQSDLDMVARFNRRHGPSVLITILQSRQDLAITDDTVRGSASNEHSPEVLDYILGTQDVSILNHSLFMNLLQSEWTMTGEIGLVEKLLTRFWFTIRNSKNISISEQVVHRLATNRKYGLLILSLLMDHGNCEDNDFKGLTDYQIVPGVATHMRTCSVQISKATMAAALFREPAAITYLQNHTRPNVTFEKKLADAEPQRPRAPGVITARELSFAMGLLDWPSTSGPF